MHDLETIRDLFYRSYDYLAENGSGFRVGHEANCHWSISGLENPYSNRLAIYNADPELFERLLEPFYEANLPHYVKLGGPGLEHASSLIAKGYTNDGASPTMIYTLDPARDQHTLRAGLAVTLVNSREELKLAQEILSDGFKRPRDADRDYDDPFPESHTSFRYLLFDGDQPVSTTQFIRTGKFISCFATATLSEHQKKGFGNELMRWALAKHAAEGDETVVLHSSEPGQLRYTAIGFQVLEYFQNWQMNSWKFKRTEIGYGAFAASRGTGVIPTVLRQLVEFLFEEYGFERIEVRTDVKNLSSRRAAEKAGFSLEGELRRNFLNLGEVTDDAIFSIIKSDLAR